MVITDTSSNLKEIEVEIKENWYVFTGDTYQEWDELSAGTRDKLLDIDQRIKRLDREAMELVVV